MAVNESTNVREYLLSIDDLGKPKVVDMSVIKNGIMNSAIILLAKLITMKKGTNPDIPDMGVDIKGRYRFSFDSEMTMLQDDIEQQVATYLPEFLPVNVVCSANGENPEEIIIRITVNGILYELIYNSRSSVLSYMNGV